MVVGSLFRPQQVRAGTYENGAFDPASGFVFSDESQSILSDDISRMDELALIAAAREELKMRRGKTVKQERKEELAKEVLSTDAMRSRLVEVFKYVFVAWRWLISWRYDCPMVGVQASARGVTQGGSGV